VSTNTVFLRLTGPMQSWGTESRLQLRRSDAYPSKSGVIGLVLCAKGVSRDSATPEVQRLNDLVMGVRIDHPGTLDWDYHTAGAKIGIRKAEGGIKRTESTKKPETLLSRRQYLLDASFLVALQGSPEIVEGVTSAVQDPVWPYFLGRKCCIPTEPVFAGVGTFSDIQSALASQPLVVDGPAGPEERVELAAYVDHQAGTHPPDDARLVYDVPRTLRNPSHGARWIKPITVSVPLVASPLPPRRERRRRINYASAQWRSIRAERLAYDSGLCVFCKMEAEDVHHVTYERVGAERIEDLRSLCKICHDACTQLEYGSGMNQLRIDPADPSFRETILNQVHMLLAERRLTRRSGITERVRSGFLTDAPDARNP
jgi:CRISPR system Cascade subunit CasD